MTRQGRPTSEPSASRWTGSGTSSGAAVGIPAILPVPAGRRAIAFVLKRGHANDELATITRDVEVERVRRCLETAKYRRRVRGARAWIDRLSDTRELFVTQRAAAIVGHRHTIDSGRARHRAHSEVV